MNLPIPLKLVPANHPLLHAKLQPVDDPRDPDIKDIAAAMLETVHIYHGIGLSANQVGLNLRIFVVNHQREYVFINPEVVFVTKRTELSAEGCLSLPGIFGQVHRSWALRLTAHDRVGQHFKLYAQGTLAFTIQHELDHLNGVLFTERTEKLGLGRATWEKIHGRST